MFYSVSLPKSPAAPGLARQALERVTGDLPPEQLADARLLVSEMVSNAVEHVREEGDIEVRVRLADGVLRVEVLDRGQGFTPAPREPGASQLSGWGLHFTALVASRWGADVDGRARVWFELDALSDR